MNSTKLSHVTNLCKQAFSIYDEVWIVGNKGDHANNLLDLGIIPQIDLAHVHSSLGIDASHLITPPVGSSRSVESIFQQASSELLDQMQRACDNHLRICMMMPFPNVAIENFINSQTRDKVFTPTAPTETASLYLTIENKLITSRVLEQHIDSKYIIPWQCAQGSDMSFVALQESLNLIDGQGVYCQKAISAGGNGTTVARNQIELDKLVAEAGWRHCADTAQLKLSAEIIGSYPANGSGCIIPITADECLVLVDPLSRKPMGPSHSSLANDWSQPWPADILQQYIELTTSIGRLLYTTYGYTGLFGPDYLVTRIGEELQLKITEINPRWQGTTPYQTQNALHTGRIPLELLHYLVKLDADRSLLGAALKAVGGVANYNTQSVNSPGCFYIKLPSPSTTQTVTCDINGTYRYDGKQLMPISTIPADQRQSSIVRIKAPRTGEVIGQSPVAIGYISGRSTEPVCNITHPELTSYGASLLQLAGEKMCAVR